MNITSVGKKKLYGKVVPFIPFVPLVEGIETMKTQTATCPACGGSDLRHETDDRHQCRRCLWRCVVNSDGMTGKRPASDRHDDGEQRGRHDATASKNNPGGVTRSWRELISRPGGLPRRPKAPTILAGTLARFDGGQLLLIARLVKAWRLRQ